MRQIIDHIGTADCVNASGYHNFPCIQAETNISISSDKNLIILYEKNLGILSENILGVFQVINLVCVCSFLCLFGIQANLVNVIIFLKQGFTNSVNVSLFALSVSDLCCLLTLLWIIIWMNPFMAGSHVPVNTLQFQYITGACPHVVFGRITLSITIYITAERCLCILAPLKVKRMMTNRLAAIAICVFVVINVAMLVPDYATSYLDWKFSTETNRTILGLAYTSGRETVVSVVFFLYCASGILAFIALVVFTCILVVKLKQSSEWRQQVTSKSSQSDAPSTTRDKKTAKMIMVIAAILIVCYTPGTLISLTTFVEPEFYLQGRYFRLCSALWTLAFVFAAVNSSVNIFLYYKMSSNYRKTFQAKFKFLQSD